MAIWYAIGRRPKTGKIQMLQLMNPDNVNEIIEASFKAVATSILNNKDVIYVKNGLSRTRVEVVLKTSANSTIGDNLENLPEF